jgi:chromosome segregation ATPase
MKRALEPVHGPSEENDQISNENAPRPCIEEDGASEEQASKTKRRNTHEGEVDAIAQEHVNSIEVANQGRRDAQFELCKEQEKLASAQKDIFFLRDQCDTHEGLVDAIAQEHVNSIEVANQGRKDAQFELCKEQENLASAEKQIMFLRDQCESAKDESVKCKEVNIELQRDKTELQRVLTRSREHHTVLREIIIPELEKSKFLLREDLDRVNETLWKLEVDVEDDHAEVVKCKMVKNAHQRRNRELQGRIRVLNRSTELAKDIISGLEIDLAKTEKKLATTKKELDKLRQDNAVHMGASSSETMKLSAIIKILAGTATVVELEVDE